MHDVTFGIKTLLRPRCLERLLKSIAVFYPGARVVVVDDGPEPSPPEAGMSVDVAYHHLPYDTGSGAARNTLVDLVETDYFLYLDDDYVFSPDTRIEWMRAVLDTDQADLVAGQVRDPRGFRRFHGLLSIQGTTLVLERRHRGEFTVETSNRTIRCLLVDVVLNFFLIRTELVRQVRWDPDLKTNEHLEFFLRAKDRLRIAFCPDVFVDHAPARNAAYDALRRRAFLTQALKKHGLSEFRSTHRRR